MVLVASLGLGEGEQNLALLAGAARCEVAIDGSLCAFRGEVASPPPQLRLRCSVLHRTSLSEAASITSCYRMAAHASVSRLSLVLSRLIPAFMCATCVLMRRER